jgi:hypothetical protein
MLFIYKYLGALANNSLSFVIYNNESLYYYSGARPRPRYNIYIGGLATA